MKTLGDYLRDADPLRSEPALADDDVQRIRRIIVDEAVRATHEGSFTRELRWTAVTAAVALTAALGVMQWIDTRPTRGIPADSQNPQMAPAGAVEQDLPLRQMQFVTAGGTRVIWTFNQEF